MAVLKCLQQLMVMTLLMEMTMRMMMVMMGFKSMNRMKRLTNSGVAKEMERFPGLVKFMPRCLSGCQCVHLLVM